MNNRIIGNPTTTPMAIPDWKQTDETKADFIKNKPDVVERTEFNSAIEALNPTPIKTIPDTLELNKEYNFGEVTELALAFPTVANDGDVIYLTFKSGATPTTLSIDTTNTVDIEIIPEANCYYDIFAKYNGTVWLVNYGEYQIDEV